MNLVFGTINTSEWGFVNKINIENIRVKYNLSGYYQLLI